MLFSTRLSSVRCRRGIVVDILAEKAGRFQFFIQQCTSALEFLNLAQEHETRKTRFPDPTRLNTLVQFPIAAFLKSDRSWRTPFHTTVFKLETTCRV